MNLFSRPTHHVSALELIRRLPEYRWPMAVEIHFQNAVAEWLERERIDHQREYDLGPNVGTIDFYFPHQQIGLELKVKGSHAAVLRQLLLYARSEEIDEIILLTRHAALGAHMPSELAGKPLSVITTWAGAL